MRRSHAEEPELGKRRRLELLVGDDVDAPPDDPRAMQLNLIEVGNLAQFLGDADFVCAVARLQRLAGNRDVLVVIHGEVLAVARTGAQRRDAQHVGDELEAARRSR